MNQIEQVRQQLHAADGLPAVLSAGWDVFEYVRAVAGASADRAADMYPAFTFARSAAVSGRNAITFAPSMPAGYAEPPALTKPVPGDVYELADAIAGLASALGVRLRDVAGLAPGIGDQTACADAALEADQISALLAKR